MHLKHLDVPAHFGLRTSDYKLIFFNGMHYDNDMYGNKSMYWKENSSIILATPPAWEFYDLKRDPTESTNRYNDSVNSADRRNAIDNGTYKCLLKSAITPSSNQHLLNPFHYIPFFA